MLNKRKTFLTIVTVLVIFFVIALIMWLKPQPITAEDHTNALQNGINPNALNLSKESDSTEPSFASKSQQDIQINCQLSADSANRLIVNEATKNCFEFFITQFGEKTLNQIKTDFIKFSQNSYKDPLQSQLIDLWTRYIQYRENLGDLQAPNFKQDEAKYYKAILSNMQSLRKKFFSNYEIEGLFGTEDVYNDYTIKRMEVMDDTQLSEQDKAKKLKELFENLPEDWKENLQQVTQLDDLRKLTAEIKARGGSAEELRQMRTELVGPEATDRLEKLDVQRNVWRNKVNQHLSQRAEIINSHMSEAAKQTAIQKLRQQNFNSAQDQLRIKTFETIHDQGGPLPFSD